MTQRHAPILLLTALLAAGPVLAQTAAPDPQATPPLSPGEATVPADQAPAATATPDAQPPAFTPVPIDDPLTPAPIAARAVPPDYSAPTSVPAATPAAEPEPQPTPTVDGVPTEPEQAATSPEAARAAETPAMPPAATTGDAPEPPSSQSLENGQAADPDSVATAATPPEQQAGQEGAGDGTSPGSAGSSGWTGGIGGSTIGTNPSGAVPESRTWQPPTSRGLDLEG